MNGQYYRPQPMAADSAYHINGSRMSGFLATVAGTLTVTGYKAVGGATDVLVDALPVVVGFNRIPLLFQTADGAIVQLAGGAAGSLLI